MDAPQNWLVVRFDDHAIHIAAHPPDGSASEQRIAWDQVTRVCFRRGRWPAAGELFVSTGAKPDGYQIPLDPEGGTALWAEVRARGLFSEAMAREAAEAPEELLCSPRRPGDGATQRFPLYSPRQLPALDGAALTLTWDQDGADSIVRFGDTTVWRERTGWEAYGRFEQIALILKHAYGSRLLDLAPTPQSRYALLGDSSAAALHVASAREALGSDAPVEAFFWLQLQDAIRAGDSETIRRFLAQGGDPNTRRAPHDRNDTLLHMAARRRRPAIARMLIAAGARVNTLDALLSSPLAAAMDTYFLVAARPPRGRLRVDPATLEVEPTTELVTMLVLAGANLSGLDRPLGEISSRLRGSYQPPLHLAARHGYVGALRLLLEYGAYVDGADFFGNTALHQALNNGQAEVAAALIAAGADVDRPRSQPGDPAETPLLMVVQSREYDTRQKVRLIRALAEAGADVNKTNTVGDTPLLAAVRHGTERRYAIIGVADEHGAPAWRVEKWPVYEKLPAAQVAALAVALRAAGADPEARDRDGSTARDLALAAGLDAVAALV